MMDYRMLIFLDGSFLCNWLQTISTDNITYVTDGDLPSNNLLRQIKKK